MIETECGHILACVTIHTAMRTTRSQWMDEGQDHSTVERSTSPFSKE